MGQPRLLLAVKNTDMAERIKRIAEENGCVTVDTVTDGHECLRKTIALEPDVLVTEYELLSLNGYEVSKVVLDKGYCDIIMIAPANSEELLSDLTDNSRFTVINKPLNGQTLVNTVDVVIKKTKRIKELTERISELKERLETRKQVEKAKGIIMKQMGLSEEEAFKKIQKQSMNRGIPMKDIAKAVILAYDI